MRKIMRFITVGGVTKREVTIFMREGKG